MMLAIMQVGSYIYHPFWCPSHSHVSLWSKQQK